MTLTLAPNALRLLFRPTRSIVRKLFVVAAVVAQHRQRPVQIVDDDVDVAVVVEVAERGAAADGRRGQRRSEVFRDFRERAVTVVAVERACAGDMSLPAPLFSSCG